MSAGEFVEMVDCPCCGGIGKRGECAGYPMPCPVCLGKKQIKDDPWWIAYYKRNFGCVDGIQLELKL